MEADSYDNLVRFYEMEHAAFLDDLPLYRGYAERDEGTLLELGCGTGRLLVPLVRAGHDAIGVDCSAPMLTCARHKIASLSHKILSHTSLIQADMRDIRLGKRFSLVFIALNTFTHLLTRDDQKRALSVAAHHLSAQGRLVIDVANPLLLPALSEPLTLQGQWQDWGKGETILKFTSTHYDPASQLEELVLIYDLMDAHGHVVRSVHTFVLRHTYRREMELLLEQAGLRVETCYGSYGLDPYGAQSEQMIFVACPS